MIRTAFVLLALAAAACPAAGEPFTFFATADMREYSGPGTYDNSDYFRGACEAIDAMGAGAFMVSPGDIDPPDDVRYTIDQILGTDYLWYPVVGNHEAETSSDMAYLRAYDLDPNGGAPPNIVSTGPTNGVETNYSFDYENAHFVVINEYYDGFSDVGTDGDVLDSLYEWLQADLAATTQQHVFVFGHEPAYPQPDEDNGRLRHEDDSLNKYPVTRDRFWNLLRDQGVIAYICGHTHNYSAYYYDGVWQLDAGHSRGAGDTGAASTFLAFHVDGDAVWFYAYRDTHDLDYDYDDIVHAVALNDAAGVGAPPPTPAAPLLTSCPNPFNPAANIRFLVPEPGRVRLTVHDTLGRCVAILADRHFDAGSCESSWDGRDENGDLVGSGVYLLRVETAGASATRKITLLR